LLFLEPPWKFPGEIERAEGSCCADHWTNRLSFFFMKDLGDNKTKKKKKKNKKKEDAAGLWKN
jgi:hypothetical protein